MGQGPSFTQSILPALDSITENVLGPNGLDLLPTNVAIVTRTWTQGRRGAGGPDAYTEAVLQLPPSVTVRHVTTREIASSGGRLELGDLLVGPIRPPFTDEFTGKSGGFTEDQIKPVIKTQGVEVYWRLTSTRDGGSGVNGEYELREMKRDNSFFYEVLLRRRETTP